MNRFCVLHVATLHSFDYESKEEPNSAWKAPEVLHDIRLRKHIISQAGTVTATNTAYILTEYSCVFSWMHK